jgi:molecular chaperone GrpE
MKRKEKVDQTKSSETPEFEIQQEPKLDTDGEVINCDCSAGSSETMSDVEFLQAQAKQLMQDVEEANNKYLRSLADFDNFRKRQREEVARQISWARENLLSQMIGISDNLARALTAANDSRDFDSLLEGVGLTLRQMVELLKKEGVEPIEAEGQEFNPELHEAMMRDTSGEHPENIIIQEFEKGYTFDGRVIRPSKVKVSSEE